MRGQVVTIDRYRKLGENEDPFDALPSQQMLDALEVVKAMAHHQFMDGHSVPADLDDFDAVLTALHRRVVSNQQACAWSDYRKEYGVSAGALAEAHKAFIAGWEARQGKSFEGGPLR